MTRTESDETRPEKQFIDADPHTNELQMLAHKTNFFTYTQKHKLARRFLIPLINIQGPKFVGESPTKRKSQMFRHVAAKLTKHLSPS